ncbi:MAG: DUF4139 domain-containing protein [Deltaproteobacteria bacterium]|nr:DUF4139 domain-containing protein [Deltaproteobacteria bacterium]
MIEQNFEYDLVSSEKILEKYIDHPIEIIRENGELVRGVLLNKQRGSLVLRTDNGIKLLPWNDETTISVGDLPEGLITRPTLVWALAGVKGDKEKVEVSYLTTGMDWQAQYVGVLDAKSNSIGLDAWVSVNNRCGTTFKDAKLKLVAGEVHRALAPESRRREKGVYQMQAEAVADRGFKEREFFEYHIYDLGRRTTVKNNQIKQIALFPPATNKENAGLGKPLPAGVFRIYKKDQASLEFVGEDRIDHTPSGEEIKITVGKAFDLRGERKVVKSRKISDRSERRTIEIELRNNKEDEDVKIVVEETLYYRDWDIEEANFPYTKKDVNHVEFQVPVKAQGKAVVRYRLLRRW